MAIVADGFTRFSASETLVMTPLDSHDADLRAIHDPMQESRGKAPFLPGPRGAVAPVSAYFDIFD
jgi:hypothetical protein